MVCRTDWFVDEFHGNESLLLLVIHISNNLRDHRNCMQMPTTRTDFVFLWRGGEGVGAETKFVGPEGVCTFWHKCPAGCRDNRPSFSSTISVISLVPSF